MNFNNPYHVAKFGQAWLIIQMASCSKVGYLNLGLTLKFNTNFPAAFLEIFLRKSCLDQQYSFGLKGVEKNGRVYKKYIYYIKQSLIFSANLYNSEQIQYPYSILYLLFL